MTTAFPNTTSGRKTLCLVQPGETSTLDDAIDRVLAHPHLDPIRKRDMVSALRRVAAACDLPPSQLLADLDWLRQKLATVPVLRLGNSPKTRANVLSNAVAALEHAGMRAARRPKTNRLAWWQRLWDPVRDCAATTIATEDPEHVMTITPLLGHTSLRTAERHYNHARCLEAGRRYQKRIRELRGQMRPIRHRFSKS
jgi:hypothetical protein